MYIPQVKKDEISKNFNDKDVIFEPYDWTQNIDKSAANPNLMSIFAPEDDEDDEITGFIQLAKSYIEGIELDDEEADLACEALSMADVDFGCEAEAFISLYEPLESAIEKCKKIGVRLFTPDTFEVALKKYGVNYKYKDFE